MKNSERLPNVFAHIDAKTNPEYYMNGISFDSSYVNKSLLNKRFRDEVEMVFDMCIHHDIHNEIFGTKKINLTKDEYKKAIHNYRYHMRESFIYDKMNNTNN